MATGEDRLGRIGDDRPGSPGGGQLDGLRPAEFCALERQLVAAMAMRKKRHVEMGPVQRLKLRLLEHVEAADPEPSAFAGALAEAVIAISDGPGTGPAQAVASDLQMDWDLACASPGFVAWLRQAATRRETISGNG
jgi:hypothetical protein